MTRGRLLAAGAVVAVLTVGPGLAVGAMEEPPDTTSTTATTPDDGEDDEPTDTELNGALIAILGAIGLIGAVVLMVNHAHNIQRDLALAATATGGVVHTAAASAAFGNERAAAPGQITITAPAELRVGTRATYSIDNTVQSPTWSIEGIDDYSQSKPDEWTLHLTPQETKPAVVVKVASGTAMGTSAPLPVQPAAKPDPFVVRLFVRNWGLVAVAIGIVFGAIALGLARILDGGDFIALVAPLAALLGVTAAGSGTGGGSDGGSQTGGGS